MREFPAWYFFKKGGTLKVYLPTKLDVMWADDILDMLNDNATLAFPHAMLVYQVDKQAKTMVLQNREALDDWTRPDRKETHERTVIVFAQLGYKVT